MDKKNLISRAKSIQQWYAYQQRLKTYFVEGSYQKDYAQEQKYILDFVQKNFIDVFESTLTDIPCNVSLNNKENILLNISDHVYRMQLSENNGYYNFTFFINADPPQNVFSFKLTRDQDWKLIWQNKENEDEFSTSEDLVFSCFDFMLNHVEENFRENKI